MGANRDDVAVGLPKTEGNIVGNIDGRVAAVHFNGSHGKPVFVLPSVCHSLAVTACRFYRWLQNDGKITATMAACRIRQNGSLPLFAVRLPVPEDRERMNGVNDPGHTKRGHVKDLGVAINLSHGSAAVSDFACNFKGYIEGYIECRLQAAG